MFDLIFNYLIWSKIDEFFAWVLLKFSGFSYQIVERK